MDQENRPPRYRWLVLGTWMTGHVWSYIIVSSLGFLLPVMRVELDLRPTGEGLLGSAPQAANLMFALLFGWLLTNFGPKRLSSISFFLGAGLAFFQGWAPGFLVLLLGRFLFGVASIAREPARILLVRQWIPANEIVLANALVNFFYGIVGVGFVLTPLLLKLLDDSWRDTLYVYGIVSLVLAVLWQIIGRERSTFEYEREVRSQDVHPLGTIMRYKELWILGFAMMGVGFSYSAFSVFWPSYVLDKYDISLTMSALVMGIGGGLSAITGFGVGFLVRRIGRKRQMLFLAGLLLGLTSAGLLWTGSIPILLLLFLIQSFGWSFFPIIMTIPFELPGIKPREVAVAATFLESILWIGALLGPILAGAIQDISGDLRLGLLVTGLLALTMTIGSYRLPRAWDRPTIEPQLAST